MPDGVSFCEFVGLPVCLSKSLIDIIGELQYAKTSGATLVLVANKGLYLGTNLYWQPK